MQGSIISPVSRDGASTGGKLSHHILGFPIAVLLALVPLKFQSMNIAAPFKTHSAVMSIFVITTLVYVVALAIEAKLQSGNDSYNRVIISKISLLSGTLATVLLVLILVPALGWFLLLVWTLLFVKLIYDERPKLQQLYRAISSATREFKEVLGRGGHDESGRLHHLRQAYSSAQNKFEEVLGECDDQNPSPV